MKKLLLGFLVLFVLFVGAVSFLITTTPGLYTLIRLSGCFLPGSLKIYGLQGRLLDAFSMESLEYQDKNMTIKATHLTMNWTLKEWVHQALPIKSLTIERLDLILKDKVNSFNALELSAFWAPKTFQVQSLTLHYLNHLLTLKGQKGLFMSGQLQVKPLQTEGLTAFVHFKGDLKSLTWAGEGHGLADLSVHGSLQGQELHQVIQWKALHQPIESSQGRIDCSGHLPKLRLKFSAKLQNQWQVQGNALGELPWRWLINANLHQNSSKKEFTVLAKVENSKAGSLEFNTGYGQFILPKSKILPALPISYDKMSLLLKLKQSHWTADGTIKSANHVLTLRGQGLLNQAKQAQLHIDGEAFPIFNTSEYQLHLSPNLLLSMNKGHLAFSGTLLIPYAQFKPHKITHSVILSDDVVFKTKNEPSANELDLSLDIQLLMGEQVALNLQGLDAQFEGGIRLQKNPHEALKATGELSIKKGHYQAFDQNLTIQQGQLIFTGGGLDNPEINLRADKKIKNDKIHSIDIDANTKVGVEVSGRLSAPKIQLFSNPASLSQADILSLMLLDLPASQANQAGGQLLLTALSSMNLGQGTKSMQKIKELKQNLGLDLSFQSSANDNPVKKTLNDNTAVVVGKALSKKLYLSYNMDLSHSELNVLTLKYLLNQFFSIQMTSSSSGNGMDVLYSGSKEKT